MSGLPSRWAIDDVPLQDPRWALVERIASSSQLQKAPQLRDILFYIAARSLTESPVAISEQQIGVNVLGRGRDFDPSQDNIVRVRIRHLRMKLEEYFSGEGSHEPLILTIPKGCYMAKFEPRPVAVELPNNQENRDLPHAAPVSPPIPGRNRTKPIAFAAVSIVAAAALLLLGKEFGVARRPAVLSPPVRADYSFYQDLLGPLGREPSPGETRLVLSNPKLMVYVGSASPQAETTDPSRVIQVPSELASKLAPATNPRDEGLPYQFIRITDQDYTGIGESTACYHLGQLVQILGRRLRLTQARFLNWDSARTENLIIVGSPDINQWAHQNLLNGNYAIEKPGIRNEKPRSGEPALYQVLRNPRTGTPLTDYALIWMLRSASGSRILVLGGCTSPGTAGAGTFFTDPHKMRSVYDRLKADGGKREFPSDWQVVLRVNIRDNLPIETTYVGHRVLGAAQ